MSHFARPGAGGPAAEFAAGALKGAPIILATVPFGLLLGAIAVQKGLSLLEIGLMSLFVFAGSAQFVAIDIWTTPAPWLALGFSALLVNLRHVLMGASIAPKLRRFPGWTKPVAMFFLADEIWALAEARADRAPLTPAYYFGVVSVFFVGWNVSTVLGGVVGPIMGDPAAIGFDFAFTAVFIALIVTFWKGAATGAVLAASAAVAALTHAHVEGAWYILAGALAGMITAAVTWRPSASDGQTDREWSADLPGAGFQPPPTDSQEPRS